MAMIIRQIIRAEEFDHLTGLVASLSEDYKEALDCFIGVRAHGYSEGFLFGELFIAKAEFERALEGLQRTSLLFPLVEKMNGKWLQFYVQKDQHAHTLNRFLQLCRQDEALRLKIKTAADEAENNITVETHFGLMQLHRREEVDSMNIISILTAIDDLRLFLDERKNLGLQYIFNLQQDQKDLEIVFAEIERLFWENLPVLRRFRSTLKEHREAFLILDDKKYPWWYPEKRKTKTKVTLQSEPA
jgi:hypothetical protein